MHIRGFHDMLKHPVECHSIIPICPHEGHVHERMLRNHLIGEVERPCNTAQL